MTNAQRGGGQAVLDMLRRELGDDLAGVIEDLVVGCECERAKPHPGQPVLRRHPRTLRHTLTSSDSLTLRYTLTLRHTLTVLRPLTRPVPGGDAAAGRGARALHCL